MTARARTILALTGAAATALATSACSPGQTEDNGKPTVVTSTNTWASVVRAVGGDSVNVTPIISDPAADPHSYESTPRDAAKLSDAELVVFNGGGYDEFVEKVLGSNGKPKPTVKAMDSEPGDAGESGEHEQGDHEHRGDQAGDQPGGDQQYSDQQDSDQHEAHQHEGEQPGGGQHENHQHEGHQHAGGDQADHGDQGGHQHGNDQQGRHQHAAHDHAVNEHAWYDLPAVVDVADHVADELSRIQPDKAAEFHQSAERFHSGIDGLRARVQDIAAHQQGKKVIVTEPVAHYLIEDSRLTDITPRSFVNAVESEKDPSAASVAQLQNAVNSRQASAVIYNPQTESPVTRGIRDAAQRNGTPVVEMTETIPADKNYEQWMGAQISALDEALNTHP